MSYSDAVEFLINTVDNLNKNSYEFYENMHLESVSSSSAVYYPEDTNTPYETFAWGKVYPVPLGELVSISDMAY